MELGRGSGGASWALWAGLGTEIGHLQQPHRDLPQLPLPPWLASGYLGALCGDSYVALGREVPLSVC